MLTRVLGIILKKLAFLAFFSTFPKYSKLKCFYVIQYVGLLQSLWYIESRLGHDFFFFFLKKLPRPKHGSSYFFFEKLFHIEAIPI